MQLQDARRDDRIRMIGSRSPMPLGDSGGEGNQRVAPVRLRRGLGATLDRAFVGFGLLVLTKAVLVFLEFGDVYRLPDEAEGSRLVQFASSLVYGIAVLLLIPRLGPVLALVRRNKAIVLLSFLAVLSASWSIDPQLSLRRGFALAGTTAFAVYIVIRFEAGEFIQLLGRVLFLIAVASWVFAIAFPEWGVHHDHHAESWRGVFLHKNQLGTVMALGTTLFSILVLERSRRRSRIVWSLGWLLSALLVLFSGSRTGWILAAVGVSSVVVLRGLRRKPSIALTLVWLVGLAVIGPFMLKSAAPSSEGPVNTALSAMDRTDSLTGRVPLWNVVAEDGLERPWLGYGYRAYWDAADGPADSVRQRVRWHATHGHNGYLDVWIEIGLFGLTVFAVGLLVAVARIVRRFRQMVPIAAVWIPLAMIHLLLLSVTESAILERNSMLWVIYLVAGFYTTLRSTYGGDTPSPSGA